MISLPLVFYHLIKMRFFIAPIRMVAVVPDPIYDFFGKNEILAVADIHPEVAVWVIPEESVDDL